MSAQGDFILRLNERMKPPRPDLLEKDYHLHRLLGAISENDYLSRNLVFKGGTCLIKAYVGYFRFSEDVDFTWRGSDLGEDGSPSQTRKICSRFISEMIENLVPIARELGLQFSGGKSDRNEVMVGSGGRMVRFYLTYYSDVLKTMAKTKFEVNFVERTIYPFQSRTLGSYISNLMDRDLEFLFEGPYRDFTRPVTIDCYDPRELFTDKCRAALTRKVYKMRDVLDIHAMEQRFGYRIPDYDSPITEKTKFMLDMYGRYKENIGLIDFPDRSEFDGEEIGLLLGRPPDNIGEEIERIHGELSSIRTKILERA
jgi:hypothetical protein